MIDSPVFKDNKVITSLDPFVYKKLDTPSNQNNPLKHFLNVDISAQVVVVRRSLSAPPKLEPEEEQSE